MSEARSDPSPSDPPAIRDGVTAPKIRGSIRDFVRTHERRRRLFPRALLAGLATGAVAIAFRQALQFSEHGLQGFIAWAHGLGPWGILLVVGHASLLGGLSVWLAQCFAPEIAGSGIPYLKAVIHRMRRMDWWRVLPLKFLGGLLAMGGGMALGREGPTVQMGGACGQWMGRWTKATARERRSLIAAGSGAGLAAAFNAPLAGVLFVLEEVQRDFSAALLAAAFVACVTADIVARILFGQQPVYLLPEYGAPPLTSLPIVVVLGLLCGAAGVAFNRGLIRTLDWFAPLQAKGWGLSGLLAGAVVGVAIWFFPETAASGHGLLENVFGNHLALGAIGGFFLLRFLMSLVSYGSGAPGGIFAPMLVLGSLLGLGVGKVASGWLPSVVPDPVVLAVLGMAAFFAAVVRGPLTGIVLIMEMTGNDGLMLHLLVACFSAYLVAEMLGERPVYEALLERDLARAGGETRSEEPVLLHFTVEEDAPYAHAAVGDIGLPSRCLMVSVESPRQPPRVPSRKTTLRPGDRIAVLVDPRRTDAVGRIHEGATGRAG